MKYYDIMLDTETTGVDPAHAAIIQISAVKFNLTERAIDTTSFFDRCLFPLPGRYWEDGTRNWWFGKNRAVLETLLPRREDPVIVLSDFWNWCLDGYDGQEPLRVWARPATFDLPILASHLKQVGKDTPWHYRSGMDMNSFLRGLSANPNGPLYFRQSEGPAHNALVDVLNQIGNLFAAMDALSGAPNGNS